MVPDDTRSTRRHRRYGFLSWLTALTSLLLAGGTLAVEEARAQAAADASEEEFYRAAQVFNEVFTEIQEKYVEDISTEELMEAAIHGMFYVLDPHSQYMEPDNYDNLTQSTQGEFFGIGIHITIRDNVLTVIAPIPNTPSARLGIQPWDRIVEINGETTADMTITEAVRELKGPRGTTVDVRIFRAAGEDGDPQYLDFTITRDEIEIASVFHQVIDDRIGYARIAQFSEETGRDLHEAIRALHEAEVEGLILDMRFNTGGLLSQAIEVSDLFLPRNVLVVRTDGKIANQRRNYHSEHDAYTDLPMLVLVNEGTASAAEIVAGALQDHDRAVIIGHEGENTFGKGSVQTIEQLDNTLRDDEDGNPRPVAIRLTTAHYYTPGDRNIHDVGIESDIGVAFPPAHQSELLRHGLLGDPNSIEPEENLQIVQEELQDFGESEEQESGEEESAEEEVEEEDTPADSVRVVDPHAEDAPAADEEFHDIMLDEAVRHMQIYLMMREEIG